MGARSRLRSIARHVSAVEELHPVGKVEKLGRTQGALRVPAQLSAADREAYERDGFVLVKGVFTPKECDDWVAYAKEQMQMQVDATAADKTLSPRAREPGTTDPEMDMLLHPKVRDALAGCMEVDGWPSTDPVAIQSMYFWQGSEQRRHQDQFYLPECMSAWTAFEDVSPRNGTVWAQAGSHKGRLLIRSDFLEGGEFHGVDYNDAVDMVYAENEASGMVETPIVAQKGDVLYFHGVLVHRGGEIVEKGSSRHVYANHYIPSTFDGEQPDRRGAGSAAQYNSWERGGIGRLSLAEVHAAVDRPTSLSFGYAAGTPLLHWIHLVVFAFVSAAESPTERPCHVPCSLAVCSRMARAARSCGRTSSMRRPTETVSTVPTKRLTKDESLRSRPRQQRPRSRISMSRQGRRSSVS
jgi:phytanoyl-CoA hydroxylase